MKYILRLFIAGFFFMGCNDNNPSGSVRKAENKIANTDTSKQTAIDAEPLFKANCANCHKCYEEIAGPALNGAFKRWTTKERLIEFIQNSNVSYADTEHVKKLKMKFGINFDHHFNNLSGDEIKAIIYWCHNFIE